METTLVHWTRIGRYALFVALTSVVPVPLLDGFLENLLRRRLVRSIASVFDEELEPADVRALANTKGSCLGCLLSVVLWPLKRILRTVFFILQIKWMADLASDVAHRGALIEEAFRLGYLPGDATLVRRAMDESLAEISPRILSGMILPLFTRRRRAIWGAARETLSLVRQLARLERTNTALQPVDDEPLEGSAGETLSALVAALHQSSTWPELQSAFHERLRLLDAPRGIAPALPARRLDSECEDEE